MEFWLRYAGALLVVGVMLAGCSVLARALRRARYARTPRRIEVLESVALAPQTLLHLVRVDAKELLVGTGNVAIVERLASATQETIST
jgi:flagellar biogenesis protein FliO